jgi:hypothetical protein
MYRRRAHGLPTGAAQLDQHRLFVSSGVLELDGLITTIGDVK